jgi:hypothetical protein
VGFVTLAKKLQWLWSAMYSLTKTRDPNTPIQWHCCDELVAPKDLDLHFKKKHLYDGSGLSWDHYEHMVFLVILASFLIIFGLQY